MTFSTKCIECGKPLRDRTSINRGMGPTCAQKNGNVDQGEDMLGQQNTLLPDDPKNFVFSIDDNGNMQYSVPPIHVHHSPSGFAWGYCGSGPTDLALNIVAHYLPKKPNAEKQKLWDGSSVSIEAWQLHQEFKEKFIAALPEGGGVIPKKDVRQWINEKLGIEDTTT